MSDRNSKQDRIDEILAKAWDLPLNEIESYLNEACAGDTEVRREVDRLLRADQQSGGILAEPPIPEIANDLKDALEDAVETDNEIKAAAADRNLLFGIVALQMNFINRDALLRAMNAWVLNKTKPIEKILLSHGDMGENTNRLLTALVDKHLEHHDNRAAKSLASLNSVGDLKKELDEIDDQELGQSVVHLGSDSTPSFAQAKTVTMGVGNESQKGGRFRVLRHHKDGGLGAVSVAQDEELNREVALKEILPQFVSHQSARDRLRVEAEITGGLEHPGIVPVYGLGSYDDGRPFYCMRFIKGDSLKDAIKKYQKSKGSLSSSERNLELRNLLRRFIDVCDAVSYAHSRSVLHRDLKPGNIMLGKYGETLVVDWGLAKATGHSGQDEGNSSKTKLPIVPRSGSTAAPTRAGSVVGTPQYMSPEQAEGRIDQLGPATDVYSLGATLYCLLTGQAAFTDKKTEDALRKVRNGDFPKPRSIDGSIPKPLEAICLKAMNTNPSQRYASPSNLGMDVERWLADESVSAHEDPWTDRFARAVRRHRTAFATISSVIAMAIIGLVAVNAVTRSKNTQLNEFNQKLIASKIETEESFAISRKLAFDLVNKAEKELSQKPNSENTRRFLTNKTIEVFEDLHEIRPNDKQLQYDLALSNRYAGNLERLLGDYKAANDNYTQAIGLMEGLFQVEPKNKAFSDMFAETLRDQGGFMQKTGNLTRAKQLLTRAKEVAEKLREEDPNSLDYQRTDCSVLIELAATNIELALYPVALKEAKEAVELSEKLLQLDAPTIFDRIFYVLALVAMSEIQRAIGDIDQASISSQKSLSAARELMEITKAPFARHLLAFSLLESANNRKALNEPLEDLREEAAEAVALWTDLSDQNSSPIYSRQLALAQAFQAMLFPDRPEFAMDIVRQANNSIESLSNGVKDDFKVYEAFAKVLSTRSELLETAGDLREAEKYRNLAIKQLDECCRIAPENARLKRIRKDVQEF